MSIKMIVTDLDRTLLRSDKTISDYTTDILHSAKKQSVMVVFATARSEKSCKQYIDLIKPNAVISNGGALVRIGDKAVYRATMDVETSNKLLLSCHNHKSLGYITVETDKGYFVNKPVDANDPNWVEYFPSSHVDLSQGLDCDTYKIVAEFSDDVTAYEIASEFSTIDVIQFTGEKWFLFSNKSANKWNGIKALATHASISISDIVAFGDDHNDLEMLRRCGIGVAVDNAIDEVKAVADHICDSNDNNGMAKWLEKNVLKKGRSK